MVDESSPWHNKCVRPKYNVKLIYYFRVYHMKTVVLPLLVDQMFLGYSQPYNIVVRLFGQEIYQTMFYRICCIF